VNVLLVRQMFKRGNLSNLKTSKTYTFVNKRHASVCLLVKPLVLFVKTVFQMYLLVICRPQEELDI